ncbi:MAG: ABC transporter permease [Candidatus Omnitrophota bacterium]
MFKKIIKKKTLLFGSAVILFMFATAIFAPFIAGHDPYRTSLTEDDMLQPPSLKHFMGTDDLGRDIFSRMVYGARISLSVGFVAVAISLLVGVVLGAISGFYGGKVDFVIMRFVEIMMCLPRIYFILMIITFLGPNITNVMIVIGLTSWAGLARMVRAEFLTQKERDYVLAARACGSSNLKIIFRHILPNASAPIFVSAALGVGGAILIESALSFLGLGVQAPVPSWGNILSVGRHYIDYAWWLTLFPGLAILLTVLSFNLVGERLRDILDPRLKV